MKLKVFTIVIAIILSACEKSGSFEQFNDRVDDKAKVLKESERIELVKALADFEKETCHQLVIHTVNTTDGIPIEEYSLAIANKTGIGYKNLDNGVLITLAVTDKHLRIEVGKGLEKYISNNDASLIIQNSMVPHFKDNNYFLGIKDGSNQIMAASKKYDIPNAQRPDICKKA